MKKEEKKDFDISIWLVGIIALIGAGLLGQYFNEPKLVVLAGTIIFGVEYFNLKREYRNK